MPITRRVFLRNSALVVVGTTAIPSFLTRAAFGAVDAGTRTKRLVVIFQRGAADGLNIVVPHGERAYYAMRPSINIPKKEVIDLDGFFGLHPSLASFQPLWNQRHLAIVHAAGSPDPTRSHFDAQDFMESGTPGLKATSDGWLNRALHSAPSIPDKSAFRAISLGPALPRILTGQERAVAVNNINDFGVGGRNPNATPIANTFEAMYDQSVDSVLHGTGQETFDAVKMLKAARQVQARARRRLSTRPLRRQPQATRAAHQSEPRRAGRLRRHRWLGSPRQRRQHAGPDCQRAT
jgi:uncharacterized protein (DUF1501 family)